MSNQKKITSQFKKDWQRVKGASTGVGVSVGRVHAGFGVQPIAMATDIVEETEKLIEQSVAVVPAIGLGLTPKHWRPTVRSKNAALLNKILILAGKEDQFKDIPDFLYHLGIYLRENKDTVLGSNFVGTYKDVIHDRKDATVRSYIHHLARGKIHVNDLVLISLFLNVSMFVLNIDPTAEKRFSFVVNASVDACSNTGRSLLVVPYSETMFDVQAIQHDCAETSLRLGQLRTLLSGQRGIYDVSKHPYAKHKVTGASESVTIYYENVQKPSDSQRLRQVLRR